MVRDRRDDIDNAGDQQFVKKQMKAIKEAKKNGNEARAQRLADELFIWLGWD